MKKNNLALSFALIAYVLVVAGVWAWCSVQASVLLPLPEKILYIGGVLVAAQTGDSAWKHRRQNGPDTN